MTDAAVSKNPARKKGRKSESLPRKPGGSRLLRHVPTKPGSPAAPDWGGLGTNGRSGSQEPRLAQRLCSRQPLPAHHFNEENEGQEKKGKIPREAFLFFSLLPELLPFLPRAGGTG